MQRSKEEILADLEKNAAERKALQKELNEATAVVWVAMYDMRDEKDNKVVGLPKYEWVELDFLGLSAGYFQDSVSRQLRVTCCILDEEFGESLLKEKQYIETDGETMTRYDDCVFMRVFTSRDRAEACLNLWTHTAGQGEYE